MDAVPYGEQLQAALDGPRAEYALLLMLIDALDDVVAAEEKATSAMKESASAKQASAELAELTGALMTRSYRNGIAVGALSAMAAMLTLGPIVWMVIR